MSDLAERLRVLSFFRDLGPDAIADVVARAQWYSLAGGWDLFQQGTPPDFFYVVVSGRLIVVRESQGRENVVGYIRAGEPVGEMSLLSGEAHSASVYALRDTELVALSRADFDALLKAHADFASELARQVLARSRRPRDSFQKSAPRVFAIVATSPAAPAESLARELATEIRRLGLTATTLVEAEADDVFYDFEGIEKRHDIVLMPTRVEESPWFRFALRHADRFLVLARRDARPPDPFVLSPEENSPARRFRLVDLVVLHEGLVSSTARDWAIAVEASRVFHWAGLKDVQRLARIVAGRSVGLVLSGGGARAYAEIGAVKALRERGVPIDLVVGASMGAIVGACVAMDWDDAEIERRIRDAFVSSNPLGDHVLPVVALTRGGIVEARLQKHFGESLIEDMHMPFVCVSSDLTRGKLSLHRMGLLRRALRASISLPGILPPVVDAEALLVDGAVINNFPTEIMSGLHRGVTIGIDVAEEGTIRVDDFVSPPGFFTWVLRHGMKGAPPIVSLLMRAATARDEGAKKTHAADIMVTPKVAGVELRDWKKYDLAVADGYRAMMEALDARWADIAPSLGPAAHRTE
ncbi:MAG: patatin-like phospholipase family protein [Parvularculaceae bacterium]|nr:patatin-like phospholipase family protein [Parvularculaceae bacterium]